MVRIVRITKFKVDKQWLRFILSTFTLVLVLIKVHCHKRALYFKSTCICRGILT